MVMACANWSSEPGLGGVCHWDGHFNWTINFWKDSSTYLDESISFPLSKTQPQSLAQNLNKVFLPLRPTAVWDFSFQLHDMLVLSQPLWLKGDEIGEDGCEKWTMLCYYLVLSGHYTKHFISCSSKNNVGVENKSITCELSPKTYQHPERSWKSLCYTCHDGWSI